MTLKGIIRTADGWRISAGNLIVEIDRKTGSLARLSVTTGGKFDWSAHPGDVTVRDDLLRRTFDRRDLQQLRFSEEAGALTIEKSFHGTPWVLRENYGVDDGAISWKAEVVLDSGDFRSCAVSYRIPWPQPMYPISFWAARGLAESFKHSVSFLVWV